MHQSLPQKDIQKQLYNNHMQTKIQSKQMSLIREQEFLTIFNIIQYNQVKILQINLNQTKSMEQVQDLIFVNAQYLKQALIRNYSYNRLRIKGLKYPFIYIKTYTEKDKRIINLTQMLFNNKQDFVLALQQITINVLTLNFP
ncbi:hypothetical protein IMG5_130990 [Ichthyophthirius multifiliis]|uniref:Uncharacterized protein n=1 Tax=Ichthyophthirius multifiliis TaxID=5932 RepID=G0QWC6_ICHMU|nr:hypothetical protein IMG5_130990 [Ichthyophthirius multifiliis]EGR30473.1 hypothetical protein IMG5_130990 [Ichthyophthirius multifiliis]|eukprot:XP_004032060.1 hypothetical protein IMG5_130990 [Ichthyophthirius multifiliis]